jgi:hypothetical protein
MVKEANMKLFIFLPHLGLSAYAQIYEQVVYGEV